MSAKQRAYKLYKYSESDLERAVERCRNGEPYRKVAAELNVPKSTLHAKLKEKVPLHAKKGPKTVLFDFEELRLKKWILDKARLGFPMHEDEVKVAVKKVLDEAKRDAPFKENKPGDKWMKLFLKRHPEIKKKQTELISKSRASVTEEKLRQWFKEVRSYLEENNLSSVLERPESIFNGDETGVQLCPKSGRLLGPRKERNFYEISSGKEKETVTVLCSFSAAGASLPPMIMFPYKRMPAHLAQSVPADWSIGRSESGWMVSSTFYEYMANVFYPWCVKQKVQFPVIYFLDGHKSHLSLELSDFCVKHQIILVSLFPNATHIIQPCDVAVFRAVKYKWREAVQLYKQETQTSITKATFAPLFKKAFDQLSVDTVKNGFRKCGLYPFDADAVDYDRCISTRRQQMVNDIPAKNLQGLEHSDFVSTKRFFDCFIQEETMKKYIEMRNENQSCDDPVYFLWNSCINKLELSELEQSLRQKNTDSENNSQQSQQDDTTDLVMKEDHACVETTFTDKTNLTMEESTTDYIFEEAATVTDVTNLVLLSPEDSIEVVQVQDNQNLTDNLVLDSDIPIIDISNLSALEDLCRIVNPRLNNADIDQSSDPVVSTTSLKDSTAMSMTETSAETMTKRNKMHEVQSSSLLTKEEIMENDETSPSNLANEPIASETNDNCSSDSNVLETQELKKEGSSNSSSSEIWDKHLLWPSAPVLKAKTKKEAKQLPCVLTCSQWREQQMKAKEEKEKKELEARERVLQRKIKKEETEKRKQKLKEERDLKKAERIKLKEEKMKIKQEKAEQKAVERATSKRKSDPANQKMNKKRCPLNVLDTNIQENNTPIDLSVMK